MTLPVLFLIYSRSRMDWSLRSPVLRSRTLMCCWEIQSCPLKCSLSGAGSEPAVSGQHLLASPGRRVLCKGPGRFSAQGFGQKGRTRFLAVPLTDSGFVSLTHGALCP